jgi:hypothetical protein
MTADFPGRPKIMKGGLAMYDSQSSGVQPTKLIPFLYNPDQVKRTLASRAPPENPGSAGRAKEEVMRVMGPPVETINLTVTLSATDRLEEPDSNPSTRDYGIQPDLAALEMLLYPPNTMAKDIEKMAETGKVQLKPANLPMTLLVFGKSRIVPVLLTSFSVTEEMFDKNLYPIQAKVDLGMKVLTYMEFPAKCMARDTFISYQTEKERLARLYPSGQI